MLHCEEGSLVVRTAQEPCHPSAAADRLGRKDAC